MKYEHNYYKTSDNLLDIEFLFLDLGHPIGWRAYVLSDINYKLFSKNRSDKYIDTHLYIDTNKHRYIDPNKDYPYICWTKPFYELDGLKNLAAIWSEITAYYIRFGGDFRDIQKALTERGVIRAI